MYHRSRELAKAAGAAGGRRVQRTHDRGKPPPMRRAGIYYHGGEAPGPEQLPRSHGGDRPGALTHAVEAYIGRFYNTRETRSFARQAVVAIYRMNRALGIPERFPCIRPEDLPQMAAWAEADPVYPVPVTFGKEDFIRMARRVMP